MKNETLVALERKNAIQKQNKVSKFFRNMTTAMTVATVAANMTAASALANGWESVGISSGDVDGTSAETMMGQVIGILLTITRYAGVALCVYGVYEVVMSFMQNQPEAKTKGIIMALSGVVMVGMKSILGTNGLGVITG